MEMLTPDYVFVFLISLMLVSLSYFVYEDERTKCTITNTHKGITYQHSGNTINGYCVKNTVTKHKVLNK